MRFAIRIPPRSLYILRDIYVTILNYVLAKCSNDIDDIRASTSIDGVTTIEIEARSTECLDSAVNSINSRLKGFSGLASISSMITNYLEIGRDGKVSYVVKLGSSRYELTRYGRSPRVRHVKSLLEVVKLMYSRDWRTFERGESEHRSTPRPESGFMDVKPGAVLSFTLGSVPPVTVAIGRRDVVQTYILISSIPSSADELRGHYSNVVSFLYRDDSLRLKEELSRVIRSMLLNVAPDLFMHYLTLRILRELGISSDSTPSPVEISVYCVRGRLVTLHETISLSVAPSVARALELAARYSMARDPGRLVDRVTRAVESVSSALSACRAEEIPPALHRFICLLRLALDSILRGAYPSREVYDMERMCSELEKSREEWAQRLASACRHIPF